MRLFVAIELDAGNRRAIAAEQARLMATATEGAGSTLRWVRPEHMHLTLAFLGEVSEERVRPLVIVMAEPIQQRPFVLGFGGLGIFPPHGAPRVLWLGVIRGVSELRAVQEAVLGRLFGAGSTLPERFQPHLTLARWRAGTGGRRVRRRSVTDLDQHRELFQLTVESVALIESRLSSAGPAHEVLARGRLEGDRVPPLQSGA